MEAYGPEYFAGRRHLAAGRLSEKVLAKIRRVAELRPEMRVLEVGCGFGAVTRLVAPHVARVEAFDISEHAIEAARREPAPANIAWSVGDALAPAERGPFDLVLALAVFEHFDADGHRVFLGRVARWLAPGGRVVIHVPITRSWSASRRQRRLGSEGVDYTGDPTHLSTFSLASFRGAIESNGFRIDREWVRYARWGLREGVSRAVIGVLPRGFGEKFAMEAIAAAAPRGGP